MTFTIQHNIRIEGIGIHSGQPVVMTLKPKTAPGIVFIRTDQNQAQIPVAPSSIATTNRSTILQHNGHKIGTPEHILAALYGLNISALTIELSQEEVPIMDGSSKAFTTLIHDTGLTALETTVPAFTLSKPILLNAGDKSIIALPHPELCVTFVIDYPESFVKSQSLTVTVNATTFTKEIGPARTYGFVHEIEMLEKMGLAKGASLENAIVVDRDKYLNKLRFEDELVRHKILDVIGDLSLLGKPLNAHIIGIKSGHELNRQLVSKIMELN